MMFYHGLDKKSHKDQVSKVAFTLQFMGGRTNFLHGTEVFGTAVCCYQTCVILVNKMATRVMLSHGYGPVFFSAFGAIDI